MKNSHSKIAALTLAFATLLLLPLTQILAQDFQRAYGTALDNSFSQVIPDGTNYYVLGQDEAVNGAPQRATVTRLDANGLHQWTLGLNIPSIWNDAVLTPSGELLVVGATLPLDATSRSLIGRVTPAGAFALLRTYDVTGRDFFTRIVRHPAPQNPAFPYYVLGAQFEPGGTPTTEDVVLFNFDAGGALNWKKLYISAGDDEFVRDFEVIGGNLVMAGNAASGLIFTADNAGNMFGGVQIPQRVYRDVAPESAGGMYAAATDPGNSEAYLQKLDASLLLQWEVRLPQLNNISQVWEGLPGEVYVTGMGTFGGQLRTVVVKLLDSGPLSVAWVKFLTAGTGFIGGSSWYLPPFGLAYTDARTVPSGFGQSCAFVSVSDAELNTCEVATENTDLLFTDPLPDSPVPLFAEPLPLPMGVNLQESSALNWQEQEVCSTAPCGVTIQAIAINNCGLYELCAIATGPQPYSYNWYNGQTNGCISVQLPCGSTNVSVSVTCSDGTVAVATLTLTVTDNVPPIALCLGVGVVLDPITCQATITPALIDGGSSDNCQIQSMSVSPAVLTGCGLHPVTLTVTDWCGNISTCQTSVQTIETTPPVIVCPPNVQKNCNTDLEPTFTGFATATDNCTSAPAITHSDVTFGVFPCDGTIQRTWMAEDECGNKSTCVQVIFVRDIIPPVLTNCPQNIMVTGTFNAVGLCVADVQIASPTATDNCDQSVALTNSFNNTTNASGTYLQGTTTVTWTATDDCGNTATCSFTVTVECADPNMFPGVHCGQAVVTCFSGFNSPASYWSGVNVNAPVMALVDVRDHSTATPGTWWTQASASEYAHPTWTPQNLGQVFGIAIDQNDDIFVAASSIYTCNTTSPIAYNPFTAAGPGAIYRIDASTGLPSNYITTGAFSAGGTTIPNNGSALGDIGYDATNDQFFVTNHADGMIYRIQNGFVMSRFDPFGTGGLPASGPGSDPSFVELRERTWGVAYYNNRVYFATWNEDIGRPSAVANEIWSIGLDGAGEFLATNVGGGTWENGEVLEITLPCYPVNASWSNPVSDIAFSNGGKMLLAERTMSTDCGGAFTTNWFGYAHSSRLLEYENTGTWTLTPGHIASVCNTNTNLKFTTGSATAIYDNSAGGVDYGYASFDPATTPQPDCDRFVWNTGDGLYPPTSYNTYCSQPGQTWVYGMQGFPATGGTNLTSLLIDFDNDVCTYDKILLGDVEIFRCGCINTNPDFPCDSLWVTKEPQVFDPGTMPDTCCWDVDFHVQTGPLCYLEVESLTPGVIFNNANLSPSFTYAGAPTNTLLTIQHANFNTIPQGDYADALTFCLGNILTPSQDTQCVVFRWYIKGPTDIPYVACTDTCKFYCPPPIFGDTCVVVKNDSVACNPDAPLEYCYFFQVQNLSDFTASQVVLDNPTPGFAFKPCPPPNIPFTSPTIALPNPALNPGVAPDSCFPQMCVKIVATAPILSPTTFCFEAGLSSNDSCCYTARKHCITLEPCCDPCEDRGVVVQPVPPQDSCCHSLDITNDCDYQFFTKLELELLTPGVIFGSHSTGGPNPGDWYNPISTSTLIQWQHISGFVPNGTTQGLINFCLDEIDMPSEVPQVVVLNWITTGSDGHDSIACSDTLIFDCPALDNKCVEVLEQNIECVEDANGNVYYQLTMTIQNVSSPPHTANELIFTQLGGPAVTVFPNPVLFSPLPFGGITTITTNIFGSGLNVGDKLTFEVRLHDSFSGDNWCCFEGDSLCVFIPDCDPCHCAPPNLAMTTTGGSNFQLTCNQTDPAMWPSLPCNSGDVTISGNIGCVGNTPGTDCPPFITWSLTGPNGPIANGTQNNGAISQTFLASQVSAPGTYTFVTTTLCPGGGEACPCYIQWIQEPCDPQCFCAPADLVVTQGSVSQTLFCTQGAMTPVLPCPPDDVTVSGFFGCTANPPPCAPTAVAWSLTGPNGFIDSGTEPNNSISLTFPQSQVTANGSYFLTLSTLCPGATDSCICTVRWIRECGDFCPDNIVQNDDFSLGTPNGNDQTIGLATDWGAIWTGGSTGDFYNTSSAPSPFGVPLPLTQGNYGAFWCRLQGNDATWREGIMNELGSTVGFGTGCYDLSFKLACLFDNTGGAPSLSVYGVTTTGFGTGVYSDGDTPNNLGMFPAGTVVELGSYLIPAACDPNFQTISLNFNSSTLPTAGITHIFFTRSDGLPGAEFVAIDDVCLVPAPCLDTCCTDFEEFCDLVDMGFTIVPDPALCKVTVTAPQFDTCQWFSTPPYIPGTNVIQVITDPDGMWMFNFNQGGTYQICVTVYEENGDSICWSKLMCTTFDLVCDTCCVDSIAFFTAAPNIQTFGTLGDCTISFQASLDDCWQISYLWGDQPAVWDGPYGDNVLVSHTYAGPGTYSVCYRLEEVDANGDVCWEYVKCEDVLVLCADTCCTDFDAFCEAVEDATTISVDPDLCKVTLNIGDLPCDDYLEYVNWGDGTQDFGPFTSGSMPMHTYSGSGTYIISYLAIELNSNGLICFEKILMDTVTVDCENCHCGDFTSMFFRTNQGAPSIPATCGGPPITNLGCPQPGKSFSFTGLFQCDGDDCLNTAPVNWTLTGPGGTFSGTTTANPYFGIALLPTYFTQPGLYTLTLNGQCGNQTCPCVIQFFVDCPNLCPCTPADIQALQAAVNQGFSVVKYPTSCKACFSPVALSDCETVVWHLNSATGPVIGTSVGNGGICHTFPSSGTYTVVMVVTRLKPDGTICEVFVKSQTVSITCLIVVECDDSDFPNPTFSLGANAGGILSGGTSAGWTAASGEPVVVEGEPGSFDAWTIGLSGNFDTSNVLVAMEPVCLEKTTGTITMRAKAESGGGGRPCDRIVLAGSGWTPNFPLSGRFAFIPLDVLDSAEWVEVEIPFDLSTRTDFDTCSIPNNGVWIQPVVYVDNALGNNQGGEATYSYAQLDHLCINGIPVTAVNDPSQKQSIRLFPNPTTGELTLEFSGATPKAGAVQILDLYGRLLHSETLLPGERAHSFSVSSLSAGMYFVRVMDDGVPVWMRKVVKQ